LKKIKRVSFFWGTQPDGIPTALFTYIPPTIVEKNQTIDINSKKYWPYDGISIITTSQQQNQPASLFIIGQIVSLPPTNSELANDVLSISIERSLGYHVLNPYDSPDLWDYQPVSLPHSIRINNPLLKSMFGSFTW
jgi:hypothetical protein